MKFILMSISIAMSIVLSRQNGLRPIRGNELELQRVVHDIVNSTNTRDVLILIRDDRNDDISTHIISTVSETLLKLIPTHIIDTTNLQEPIAKLANPVSLLVYIYGSHPNLQQWAWEMIFNDVSVAWKGSSDPKLLLIQVGDEDNIKVLDFYRFLWNNKILRVEVLEILPSDTPGQELRIIAHQYNPFNDTYNRTPNPRRAVSWYPNKPWNLYKSPVYVSNPGSSQHYKWTTALSSTIFRTEEAQHIEYLMNPSWVFTNIKKDTDLFFYEYHYLHELDESVDYVALHFGTDICLITPVSPMKTVTVWKFFGILCFGTSIVILCSIMSTLLVVDTHLRRPIYLMSVLFSFTVTKLPATLTERIMFLCLVLASARYTSMFYAELFDVTLVNKEIDINDFDDLAESGLHVMIDKDLYPNLVNRDDVPEILRERIHPMVTDEMNNLLANITSSQNKSYFFEKVVSKVLASELYTATGERIFKMTKLCLKFQNVGFAVKKRSPYRERFEEIALAGSAMGDITFVSRLTHQAVSILINQIKQEFPVRQHYANNIPLPFIMVLLCGYGLALIVFFGEICVHRFRDQKPPHRSKRRKQLRVLSVN